MDCKCNFVEQSSMLHENINAMSPSCMIYVSARNAKFSKFLQVFYVFTFIAKEIILCDKGCNNLKRIIDWEQYLLIIIKNI